MLQTQNGNENENGIDNGWDIVISIDMMIMSSSYCPQPRYL